MANAWKSISMTSFEQLQDAPLWRARIFGERSDGKTAYVNVDLYGEQFTPQFVGLEIVNALTALDVIWKDKELDGD